MSIWKRRYHTQFIQKLMKIALSFAAIVLLLTTSACGNSSSASGVSPESSIETPIAQGADTDKQLSAKSVPGAEVAVVASDRPTLAGNATVVIQVGGQPITIVVDGNQAPITAGNFVDLVQRGVYNGTKFHRVVKTPDPFVVQGGDPQSKDSNVPISRLGSGNFIDPQTNEARYIPLEILPQGGKEPIYGQTLKSAGISDPPALPHRKGAVAMARTPLPDSASAQFYFALSDLGFLDGDYAVFGYVTDGMDVVEQIQQGDMIDSAEVTQGKENLK